MAKRRKLQSRQIKLGKAMINVIVSLDYDATN